VGRKSRMQKVEVEKWLECAKEGERERVPETGESFQKFPGIYSIGTEWHPILGSQGKIAFLLCIEYLYNLSMNLSCDYVYLFDFQQGTVSRVFCKIGTQDPG
jgi:hypothetical protein